MSIHAADRQNGIRIQHIREAGLPKTLETWPELVAPLKVRPCVLRLSHLAQQGAVEMLAERQRAYTVVRPNCEGLPLHDWEDGETGIDCGWRQDVFFHTR
jgi:hypothetical protein